VEHLRQEFKKIESHFSGMSLEIMRYLLTFPVGQANRNGLMHNVWGRKGATLGAIRQSVRRLNAALKVWEFGYTIRGSRKGIYRFVPLER
jgi:DNA-binding winged helix-turn-helix (wHTH) protein